MVPPTEQEEMRQRGGPALRPVAHVMRHANPHVAAREPTRPVPVLQRPPQSGWNRPRPGSDLDHASVLVVSHHHAARVARHPPGRFRGNVAPLFQHGLAGSVSTAASTWTTTWYRPRRTTVPSSS